MPVVAELPSGMSDRISSSEGEAEQNYSEKTQGEIGAYFTVVTPSNRCNLSVRRSMIKEGHLESFCSHYTSSLQRFYIDFTTRGTGLNNRTLAQKPHFRRV